MELYKVRDQVRENVGRDRMTRNQLDYALGQALRRIEQSGDYYWMRAVKTWTCVVDQQSYNITNATNGGLNIPNYKDIRTLFAQDSTQSTPYWANVYGPQDIEEAALYYTESDEGMPQSFSVDESISTGTQEDPNGASTCPQLLLWPPNPDKTYAMRLHYYQWTSLPTDITTDNHEILMRFPEALIYAATAIGFETGMKDAATAQYYWAMFDNPTNPASPGELTKIKRYALERSMDTHLEWTPQSGSLRNRSRREADPRYFR